MLKFDMKGTAVKQLQDFLLMMGYDLPKYGADSHFGKETEVAFNQFKADSVLTPWMVTAALDLGVTEVRGNKHNPIVVAYWRAIKRGGIKTDEVAWCSSFVGAMFEYNGIKSSRYESARSWLAWGEHIERSEVRFGDVVVFSRNGGGHVGLLVGITAEGNPIVLGGNQSNQVNVKVFDRKRVVGYRRPAAIKQKYIQLATSTDASISNNEA